MIRIDDNAFLSANYKPSVEKSIVLYIHLVDLSARFKSDWYIIQGSMRISIASFTTIRSPEVQINKIVENVMANFN